MRNIFKDPGLQQEFEHKGYVVVDFLNENEIAALKYAYSTAHNQPAGRAFSTTNMSVDAQYRKAVSAAITKTFDRAVNYYFDKCTVFLGIFTSKQPANAASMCSMHQDPAYVDESEYTGLTIWVPLVDTDETNGALEVIDGSHLLNEWPRSTLPRFPYSDLVPLFLDKYFRRLNIKAGQAYLGSAKVFHWSPPNNSSTERVAALAWMAEEESTLRCYYQDFTNPGDTMEVFEVQPAHYIERPLFSRPDEHTSVKLGSIPYRYEPLDENKIERIIQGVTV